MTVDTLIRELDSAGDLPAGFGALLRAVPRELFIPNQVWVDGEQGDDPIDRNAKPERWFRAVYSDTPIVTQYDDGRTKWPDTGARPTCSASAPSVVGAMLAALDVQPGQSVLEIGTGTGFNSALLAEAVGGFGHVSTIEIDSAVMAAANEHLDASGYGRRIRMLTDDGATGDPDLAPFDRVIATAAVQAGQLPYAWVEQTQPGGVIVAPMRAALSSGPLVRFQVLGDGTAVGRAEPMGVGFMELRNQRTPTSEGPAGWRDTDAAISCLEIDPVGMLEDRNLRWTLAVALPSCRFSFGTSDLEPAVWLRDPLSGSWAAVAPEKSRWQVRQYGPRRLWDEAEAAFRWWLREGQPARSDWIWTITPDRQSVTPPK